LTSIQHAFVVFICLKRHCCFCCCCYCSHLKTISWPNTQKCFGSPKKLKWGWGGLPKSPTHNNQSEKEIPKPLAKGGLGELIAKIG
jgi:hypothetical protein